MPVVRWGQDADLHVVAPGNANSIAGGIMESYYEDYQKRQQMEGERLLRQANKALDLSTQFRYGNGSYKSRKAGIQPIRAMVKATFPGKKLKFRVYGNPATELTNDQTAFFHIRLQSIKQTNRDLIRTGQIKQYKHHKGILVYA